jgi:hypothetical protein
MELRMALSISSLRIHGVKVGDSMAISKLQQSLRIIKI